MIYLFLVFCSLLYLLVVVLLGDYIQNTSLLANLGSNFSINQGLLSTDIDPMLSTFKKHYETVNKDLAGFELEDKLLLKENSQTLESWLGVRDKRFATL